MQFPWGAARGGGGGGGEKEEERSQHASWYGTCSTASPGTSLYNELSSWTSSFISAMIASEQALPSMINAPPGYSLPAIGRYRHSHGTESAGGRARTWAEQFWVAVAGVAPACELACLSAEPRRLLSASHRAVGKTAQNPQCWPLLHGARFDLECHLCTKYR